MESNKKNICNEKCKRIICNNSHYFKENLPITMAAWPQHLFLSEILVLLIMNFILINQNSSLFT